MKCSSETQLRKASLPIEVTESGTVNVLSEWHPSNVLRGIDVREFEYVSDMREEQSAKTLRPIEVTESGILNDVSEEQP